MIAWCLRIALSLAFLSAVADRIGLWGAAGASGVAWGNFDAFVAYTKLLNPWFPKAFILPVAYAVTGLEVVLGILLFTTWKTREVALVSGLLLLSFGLAMAFSLGPKAPLDYSVFTAAFGAFALSSLAKTGR